MTAQNTTPTNILDIGETVKGKLTPSPLEIFSALKPNKVSDPSFSTDGLRVIFTEEIRATFKISTILIHATPIKTTLLTGQKRFADPTYSADGFFILFAEEKTPTSATYPHGQWRLKYMNSDGTNVVTILDDGNANMHPCWITPTQIAFQWWHYGATPSSAFHIALIDLAGQGRKEMGEGEYPRMISI